ncbi:hypothetical protein DAPPUDRAFT_224885 [Daphnia pulex]|uniref:C1q domain-containing protein n=1 Tax=Daphnia pulex TaxID=6669 RepID=E9GKT1_DAPPU|nr:hypothetical protein DAPPUDRAFT_224885 [Daphnia pulex]|eukprot:EFX79914.1 hypothetical protein DAPPUDRAFT_224885 [Daphnia pulex]
MATLLQIEMKNALKAKDIRLEQLEQQHEILAKEVAQLKLDLHNEREINSRLAKKNDNAIETKSAARSSIPRTCTEARLADPTLTSGMHWIDPDGQGVGDDPIYVYCNTTTGSTSIPHDSEGPMNVGHCADPGCYSRAIKYDASSRQMAALAELSNECHQSIQYDCYYAPLEFYGTAISWWNDQNGNPKYFWSGGNTDNHICQCGIDGNCVESTMMCNCDSTAPVQLVDSGVITDKTVLPITRLNFGRTQLESSSGVHTLGRLECTGQVAVNGIPKSCQDLWRIGYTLSGMYNVMGTTMVESVYCDFTKLPNDSGFQKWMGYADVKSMPVYFYVQKSTTFNQANTPVPFEVVKLNIGNAMNIASGIFTAPRKGTYFFSLSGIAVIPSTKGHLDVGIALNGAVVGKGEANDYTGNGEWETYSLQLTLKLQAGDLISVQITSIATGVVLQDKNDHFTHFNGWLMQEELSQ